MDGLFNILRLFMVIDAIALTVVAVFLLPFGIALFLRGRGKRARKI